MVAILMKVSAETCKSWKNQQQNKNLCEKISDQCGISMDAGVVYVQ